MMSRINVSQDQKLTSSRGIGFQKIGMEACESHKDLSCRLVVTIKTEDISKRQARKMLCGGIPIPDGVKTFEFVQVS